MARWRRHQDALAAAFARIDAMRAEDKLRWLLAFCARDLRKVSLSDRRTLGYDLRALARTIGAGWSWRDRPQPLADRDLRTAQAQISAGWRALELEDATRRPVPVLRLSDGMVLSDLPSALDGRIGWRLPAHRVWLRPLPRQTDDPAERPPIVTIYEARDEISAIVAAVGHFIVQDWRRWRVCPCGCGETFIPKGKQKFFEPACENRARGKRRRDEERRKRAAGEE